MTMVEEYSQGSMLLCYDGWRAVMAAMEGDESQRGDAFDALQRWAPPAWLEELEREEEHAWATSDPDSRREASDTRVS